MNGAVSAHEEKEMSQTLVDDSEVVFDQPEESAGAMEPEGSVPNRRKGKRGWKTRNFTGRPDPERWNSTGRSMEGWVPLWVE